MALSRKKKIIIAVTAVVALALIVIVSVLETRKDEPEVTTVKLDVRPELRSTVTASGEVRPIRYIRLTSEIAGRILEIHHAPVIHEVPAPQSGKLTRLDAGASEQVPIRGRHRPQTFVDLRVEAIHRRLLVNGFT